METEDTILFEASVKVAAGVAHVYDVFVLKDGKAIRALPECSVSPPTPRNERDNA